MSGLLARCLVSLSWRSTLIWSAAAAADECEHTASEWRSLNVPAGASDKGRLSAQLLLQPGNGTVDRSDRRWTPADILAELEPMQRLPKQEVNGTHCLKVGDQLRLFSPPTLNTLQPDVQGLKAPMVASTAQWILNVGCQSSVSHLVIVNGSGTASAAATVPTATAPAVSSPGCVLAPQLDEHLAERSAASGFDTSNHVTSTSDAAESYHSTSNLRDRPGDDIETGYAGDLDSLLFGNNISNMVDMSVDELGSILLDQPINGECSSTLAHADKCRAGSQLIDDTDIFDWPSDECFTDNGHNRFALTAEGTVPIEFAPRWGFTGGGDKLLIVGPWTAVVVKADTLADLPRYACRFGTVGLVLAELVSDGILRCTIPPSAVEQCVQLQVELDGKPVAAVGTFEYRSSSCCRERSAIMDWFIAVDAQRTLRDRLADIDRWLVASGRMAGPLFLALASQRVSTCGSEPEETTEAAAIDLLRQWQLHSRPTPAHVDAAAAAVLSPSPYGLSLIHAAAALDYGELIDAAAAAWRVGYPQSGNVLSREMSPSSTDSCGCTPLHWACALGKRTAADALLRLAAAVGGESIHAPNSKGLQPVAVARLAGQVALADLVATAMHADVQRSAAEALAASTAGSSCSLPNGSPDSCRAAAVEAEVAAATSTPAIEQHFAPAITGGGSCCGGASSRKPTSRRASAPQQRGFLQRMKRQSSLSSAREDVESCLRPVASDPLIPCSVRRAARAGAGSTCAVEYPTVVPPPPPRSLRTFGNFLSMEAPVDADDGYIVDVETVSDEDMRSLDEDADASLCSAASAAGGGADAGRSQSRMRSLAEQIIAAMPERIKTSSAAAAANQDLECLRGSLPQPLLLFSRQQQSPPAAAQSPLHQSLHCCSFASYRDRSSSSSHSSYSDSSSIAGCCLTCTAPSGSAGAGCCDGDSGIATPMLGSVDELRPTSPPTTAEDFSEYFNANAANMERYFSSLTLSDVEQRRLYEAAKVIQNAYRLFKDKKQQHQREIEAAVIIQTYYRRYKKYKYQLNVQCMQQAAVRIQSQFRTYYARKRFCQSREAALVIQHQYRAYRESQRAKKLRQSVRPCASAVAAAGGAVGCCSGVMLPQHGKLRALSSRHRFKEPGVISINYASTTVGAASSGEHSSEK